MLSLESNLQQYILKLPPYPSSVRKSSIVNTSVGVAGAIKPIQPRKIPNFIPVVSAIGIPSVAGSVTAIKGSLNFKNNISSMRYQENFQLGEFRGKGFMTSEPLARKRDEPNMTEEALDINRVGGDHGGGPNRWYYQKELEAWVKHFNNSYTGSTNRTALIWWLRDFHRDNISNQY